MIGKDITYEDFEGNEITEKFWFHLTKAELLDIEMRTGEGFEAYGKKLIAAEDKRELVKLFKELILMTFGVRDPNNPKRFIKTPELTEAFSQSNAFSELYVSLFQAENMVEFFKGVLPKLEKTLAKQTVDLPQVEPPKFVTPKSEAQQVFENKIFGEKPAIHMLSDYDQRELLLLSPEDFAIAKKLEEQYRAGLGH